MLVVMPITKVAIAIGGAPSKGLFVQNIDIASSNVSPMTTNKAKNPTAYRARLKKTCSSLKSFMYSVSFGPICELACNCSSNGSIEASLSSRAAMRLSAPASSALLPAAPAASAIGCKSSASCSGWLFFDKPLRLQRFEMRPHLISADVGIQPFVVRLAPRRSRLVRKVRQRERGKFAV